MSFVLSLVLYPKRFQKQVNSNALGICLKFLIRKKGALIKKTIYVFATFFYSGSIQKAPGTFGTLAAVPLAFLLLYFLKPIPYMIVTFLLVLFSIFICQMYESYFEKHDDKHVVIDEVIGYLVTMTWLPLTWQSFVAAFVLFRFFDILKPIPIRIIDQKIKGGLGVVADDLVAGIFSNVILQFVYQNSGLLGASING